MGGVGIYILDFGFRKPRRHEETLRVKNFGLGKKLTVITRSLPWQTPKQSQKFLDSCFHRNANWGDMIIDYTVDTLIVIVAIT